MYLSLLLAVRPALSVAVARTVCLPGLRLYPLSVQVATPDVASADLHFSLRFGGGLPCFP